MFNLSKKVSLVLTSLSVLMSAQMCWAGWGAIACSNNNGACVWANGAADYQIAADEALNRCDSEYGNCEVKKWERNACVSYEAANGNVATACY
jgi:hypothetical protein